MSGNQPAFPLLHDIVGNGHRAQKHAKMTARGTKKYFHVKNYENDPDGEHLPITDEEIHAHLLGQATYAVPLIGTDELASAGLIEQDAGGIDTARRILAAAEARGVVMFAIIVKGSDGHDGCHPWVLYDGRYDPKAIRAQLKQIAEDAGASTDEIHPNNTNIRLPFGLHLRSQTRGRTLLQSGELFENDTELDAAERAVMALPLNGQPPEVIYKVINKPVSNNIIRYSAPGRASLADVKARFNAENTWPELLSDKGGIELRGGWACNCGAQHTHPIQIAITSQDKIVSFSPNCKWAPHRDSGKALDKFGFYVDQWHSGNVVAALKELNPIQAKTRIDNVNSDPAPRYTDEQRDAYNAARKEKRHAETRDALDIIYGAACNLEMSDRAHWLFAYLLGLCYERGILQVAPTNEQVAADLDMCKRYVQYAFRELEAAGLGKRQGGRNVEGNIAATWTFYRSPHLGCKPRPNAECTLDIYSIDLIPGSLDLVSRALSPAHENVYAATLDDWAWCDADHGADELTILFPESETLPKPEKVEENCEKVPILRHTAVRYHVTDGVRFGGWAATEAGAWKAWKLSNSSTIEPEAENADPDQYLASYTPVAEPAERSYTGTPRDYLTLEQRRQFARDSMRPRETPHADVVQLDMPEDEPEVLSPPTNPTQAEQYYRLLGAARKARSLGQRIALERKAQALMVYVPISQVAVLRARSQAPTAFIARRAYVYTT